MLGPLPCTGHTCLKEPVRLCSRVVIVSTAGVLVRTSVDVDVKEILEGGNVMMVVDVIVAVAVDLIAVLTDNLKLT